MQSLSICPRLIEVALPIREISAESVRDKSLRHGHISTLHLWWARRPLSAARAIVFASLVPDPDDLCCPPEFRQAVVRLLQTEVPKELHSYTRGRNRKVDPDPYKPYSDKAIEIPDTPRNRLLTFIARWSPEWLAFERGDENSKQPPPAEMLDDRCLVKWETSDPANPQGRAVLRIARELIRIANGGNVPTVLDPFAGGGAIPLEATRLGCRAIANDYNPVAYLILRATCEFPQKYGIAESGDGETRGHGEGEKGSVGEGVRENEEQLPLLDTGAGDDEDGPSIQNPNSKLKNPLARDVEYWARWILERARERIGHLYPPGKDGRPIVGYLWARTAPCSNPACRAEIPLLRSLLICNKPGKRVALVMTKDEIAQPASSDIHPQSSLLRLSFGIANGADIRATDGTMIRGGDCRCLICQQVTPVEDLRRAGLEGRLGERMVTVITNTPQGKDYRAVEQSDLDAFAKAAKLAQSIERPGEYIVPEINAPNAPTDAGAHRSISVDIYGFKTFGSLFNSRQLTVMQTFVGCLNEAVTTFREAHSDIEYVKAVTVYLGLWLSRNSTFLSNLGIWKTTGEFISTPFSMQAIPMVWDYAEANVLNTVTAGALSQLDWVLRFIQHESVERDSGIYPGHVFCGDAERIDVLTNAASAVVTDPPYFDAIAYADLSDFFYVWLKRCLNDIYPSTFSTPQTPNLKKL